MFNVTNQKSRFVISSNGRDSGGPRFVVAATDARKRVPPKNFVQNDITTYNLLRSFLCAAQRNEHKKVFEDYDWWVLLRCTHPASLKKINIEHRTLNIELRIKSKGEGMMRKLQIILLGVIAMSMLPTTVFAEGKGLVVVAGSTGRTGQLVVKHLLAEGYEVRAMVRSMEKGKRVLGDDIAMVKADVTDPASLPPLLEGANFVISAIGSGKASPEDVDYGGGVALIDAAKAAGIKKFVMITSGGVTWRFHPLNWTGDNVLKWKRKAELYLRASGLTHVIVRPNGSLSDKPANTNRITFRQNDKFAMKISRDDVAVVCVKALRFQEADNKTFEIQNDDDGSAVKDVDWKKTFGAMVVKSDNF